MNKWQQAIIDFDGGDDDDRFIGTLDRKGLCIMIDTMTDVVDTKSSFDMWDWNAVTNTCSTVKEQHKCGMAACLGGWTALHPDFKKMGGGQNRDGAPTLGGDDGGGAISVLVGLDPYHEFGNFVTEPHSVLYEDLRTKNNGNKTITARNVLARLKYILKLNDKAMEKKGYVHA